MTMSERLGRVLMGCVIAAMAAICIAIVCGCLWSAAWFLKSLPSFQC